MSRAGLACCPGYLSSMGITISAIAATATIASAIFIAFQVGEMKRQTRLQREIAEAAVAPYVWADVRVQQSNGWNLEFAVGNSGQTVARNVVVIVEPPIPKMVEREARHVDVMQQKLRSGLSSIAPGRTYRWSLGSGASLVNRDGSLTHTITIDGVGPSGPIPRSEYVIDFGSFREAVAGRQGTLHNVAVAIAKASDKMIAEQERQTEVLRKISGEKPEFTFADDQPSSQWLHRVRSWWSGRRP